MAATEYDSHVNRGDHARDTRPTAPALLELEGIITRMEDLGRDAEDAQARMTAAMPECGPAGAPRLADAIADVIAIMTERSRLAHRAHRLIGKLRGYGAAPANK